MSTLRSRGLSALVTLVATGVLIAGCSSQPQERTAAQPESHVNVSAADAKAPVTMDAYEAAFTTFSKCMSDSGAELINVRKEGVVWRYSFSTSAEDVYGKCYGTFAGIDSDWQLANEYNSETFIKLRQCLTDAGITPGATVEDVWSQINANKIDPVECTTGQGR